MKHIPKTVMLGALLLAARAPGQSGRVLFLTHSAGFEHPVVKRSSPAALALAEDRLLMAASGQFEVLATKDCSLITRATLKKFSAVVFYTSGELPISAENREALIEYVQGGGGFVGVHSATDTFFEYAPYGAMLGGYFDGHPWNQKVRIISEDRRHPATIRLGESFEIADEIYQFRDFSRAGKRVLLSLAHDSVRIDKGKRKDGDYALAWCSEFGKGRVFYTALGHRKAVWKDKRFLQHLVAGIRWAMNAEELLSRPHARATVLFDGSHMDRWEHRGDRPAEWRIVDESIEVRPDTGSIRTREKFRSFRLHLEFRIPEGAGESEERGNSGIFLQERYEIQLLDSFGKPPGRNGCGAIYGQKAADVNVCRKPGEWQSMDITFKAAVFDADGKKLRNARISALQNGIVIHDDVEVPGPTASGKPEGPEEGPVKLQEHGARVRFRNIWIVRY
ncbi:MAG: ThuA domain-containing protein [Planctomycetota bacterium]